MNYALIWDFEVGLDQIQLAGSAADYTLTEAPAGLAAGGTALWLNGQGGAEDELIAVIRDVSGLSLIGGTFLYEMPFT